jgi:hypothetical protein
MTLPPAVVLAVLERVSSDLQAADVPTHRLASDVLAILDQWTEQVRQMQDPEDPEV